MKVIATSSKQMPIKEINKNNNTLLNYSFAELLMLSFVKKFLAKRKEGVIPP
jgi:hypothetical protein